MFVDQKSEGEAITHEAWRDLILRMRDYINEHGWCQMQQVDWRGRVCILGAYQLVQDHYDDPVIYEAFCKLADATEDAIGIARWNDARGRTKEEVIALLETVAGS